jgi:hypothetical protein
MMKIVAFILIGLAVFVGINQSRIAWENIKYMGKIQYSVEHPPSLNEILISRDIDPQTGVAMKNPPIHKAEPMSWSPPAIVYALREALWAFPLPLVLLVVGVILLRRK